MVDRRTDKEKGLHYHQTTGDQHGNHTGAEGASKNFDQKIYLFPESYNQLRKELSTYWPNLWAQVSWPMVFAAGMFIERMNDALDMNEQLDSERVDAICTAYLEELHRRRVGS